MKYLVILLVLIGFTGSAFALYDGTENSNPHEPKNELEQKLVLQGFIKQEYPLMPYGFNHYFTKIEPQLAIGSEDFNRCSYIATFPLHLDEKAHIVMKFPTDFEWAGAYNYSTFFVVNGGSLTYTEHGETVTIDEPYVFNSIEPSIDSEYITIEFELDGGMNHLIINSTNVFESDNHTPIPCKPKFEKPKQYSYYDRIFPIPRQIEYLKLNGFPSDSFVCKSGLVGVLKYDGMPACVTESTKQKLIERGWTTIKITKPVSNNHNPYETKCGSSTIPHIPKNWHETEKQPSDEEWENLGRHLMKQEFYKQLKQQNIIFEPACFGIYKGDVEWSYPPRISMCTVINELDGDMIYLEGTVHGFDVINFEMTRTIPYQCDELHAGCFCNMDNENSDTHVLKYSPVLFSGTGVDLQDDELIDHLKEKRKSMDVAFEDLGVKGLYPITGESFSIGHNAYSLDEKYVGKPIALDIHVLKEEFTKENLEKVNQLVRKYVGGEIDIVYSKGGYVPDS